ncbi:MAG TPA: NRDE family protein [Lysobacter sp.]
MCLIAVAWQSHPRYRLALIANRDELHARPASPAGPDPQRADVYGGRDLQLGGSWLLASTRGRLAAVTNVRAGLSAEPMPRSRGALVHDFVHGDADGERFLSTLADTAAEYGRFNLLVWDGKSLRFASNHPHYTTHSVAPGLHAMSNGAFDAAWPKSGRAMQSLDAWLRLSEKDTAAGIASADVAPLFEALADTTPAPDAELPDTGVGLDMERALSPPFVRSAHYGTRCSSVVVIGNDEITFVERRFGADAVPLGETSATLRLASPA